MNQRYFWTKVWGAPHPPANEALAFSHKRVRDRVLSDAQPGDIIVYLTSDATHADSSMRGRVAGAVQISDVPEPVMVEDLRGDRNRPEHYRKDGRFRWPFGVTLKRTWKVIDQEANDTLIPNHADLRLQGAATIHRMTSSEIQRFQMLRVEEQIDGAKAEHQPFAVSLRRPWRQKGGIRASAEVTPGSQLYVAVIRDDHGMTFKVGSGKAEERIKHLNYYRRGSLGEVLWSRYQIVEFDTVDAARAAEDHILQRAKENGYGSTDNPEFLCGIEVRELNELISEAVEIGSKREAAG